MRNYLSGTIGALGLMSTLGLGQACVQKPRKVDGAAINSIEVLIGASAMMDTEPAGPSNVLSKLDCVFEEGHVEQGPARNGLRDVKSQLLHEINQTGLSQEKAIQLVLVNNPDLFAYYENLELGYAGLIEAGLRQNPVINASLRFPRESGYRLNKLFDSAISFLDFFLIPLRTRAAHAELQVIESQVGQKVLDLVRDVQINWLELKTLELELAQEAKRVELKELAAGLAELQRKAGNISALSARKREINYQEALEKLKGLQAELQRAREKMSRSLGLFGNEACFRIAGELDWKKDYKLPDLGNMENVAIENRLDMEVIRREINAIAQRAQLKQWWTYSNLKVGVSAEREPDGVTVMGPAIELEVPIFNYGQGEAIKYGALLEQAQKRLLAKAIQACSEVREFLKTANIYQSQLEDLEIRILPDFAKQISAGLSHYNVMTLGIFELFEIKESEIQATINHTQALQHYIQSQIELLHALGGSFAISGRRT